MQGQKIRGDRGQATPGMNVLNGATNINNVPLGAGVGQHHTNQRLAHNTTGNVGDLHLQPQGASPLGGHRHNLRVQAPVQNNPITLLIGAGHEPHSLSDRGGLVKQRRISDGQVGEFLHHGLEVQQCFQPALGDFRLVWGVGRVPARILHHIPANNRRGDRVKIALAIKRLKHHVLLRITAELP